MIAITIMAAWAYNTEVQPYGYLFLMIEADVRVLCLN